ncbi:MAG: hypothetical protein KatS3mg126_0479 [Lysobacteraceae bacterium]|nr:MAG: hypothetical protein KatS3mg126_0479 [Xanthomonadaceae bacterium]
MHSVAPPSAPLFSEGGAGPLRMLAYLALGVVLMVADHRGGHLARLRAFAALLAEPVYQLVEMPARLGRALQAAVGERRALYAERDLLRSELLLAKAQLARLQAVQAENQRLRALLGGTRGLQLDAQLVSLADIELDPFRHRVLLDAGRNQGIEVGAALIDPGGVFGQVIEVSPLRATAMLISDPAHAIPVQVRRSGVRTVVYGTGELDRLSVPNIPQSADIRVGDLLITSGLGGRFPAGLPVGTVVALEHDQTRLFLVATARPAAFLAGGRELLLVRNRPLDAALEAGPPLELAPEGAGKGGA